jgi:PmbA protein
MISTLLERAARRTQAADMTSKTDETLSLTFEAGRLKQAAFLQEQGTSLRVISAGRMGFAGTTGEDAEALLDSALASAQVGEHVTLALPRPTQLPRVTTHYPRAGSATLPELIQLGQGVLDRLGRGRTHVNLTLERSVGSVRIANTRGVDASYDVSSVSLQIEVVRVAGDDVLVVSDSYAASDLPELGDIERLVEGIQRRLAWAERAATLPSGKLPVCFTPAGAAVLLLPLHQALQGKSVLHGVSPFAALKGERALSSELTLVDDPLLDGRSGSRPVDDEGTASRQTVLIEAGVIRQFIYDLETASRASATATGHGRRTVFGKPQAAFSNLVLSPGSASFEDLLAGPPAFLLVDELAGAGQGNLVGGSFTHPVGLAYLVQQGEVVGRVTDVTVAGNAYELLGRISGLGRDTRWIGSTCTPSIMVDGVAILGR